MRLYFERTFYKDIKRIKDQGIKDRLGKEIDSLKQISTLQELPNVKKIQGYPNAYRIRIGNYRLGVFLEKDWLRLTRFLHRKDIYKKFP